MRTRTAFKVPPLLPFPSMDHSKLIGLRRPVTVAYRSAHRSVNGEAPRSRIVTEQWSRQRCRTQTGWRVWNLSYPHDCEALAQGRNPQHDLPVGSVSMPFGLQAMSC